MGNQFLLSVLRDMSSGFYNPMRHSLTASFAMKQDAAGGKQHRSKQYTRKKNTRSHPVSTYEAHSNLAALGYPVTSALSENAHAIYIRIAYGNGGSYTGTIEYGGERMTELDVSRFTDLSTKNAADLVTYAVHAWESGWGYVWGTYGNVLMNPAHLQDRAIPGESAIRKLPSEKNGWAAERQTASVSSGL